MPEGPAIPRDNRYSIRPEFSDHPKAQFVVRYCGDVVGSSIRKLEAQDIAASHACRRRRQSQFPARQ